MDQMQDTFPGLFWGYTIIWLLVVLYVLSLGRRMRRLERDTTRDK
jgi:CcmD family protein